MTEIWRAVVGYEGYYEVSDLGNVRSVDRLDTSGKRRRGTNLATFAKESGHRRLRLRHGNKGENKLVHRLVLEAFAGPRPDGMEACHNDGDPANNRLENLRWDTRSANGFDRVRHGNHPATLRTHCPIGHRLAEPNLIPNRLAKGHRVCLSCQRASAYVAYHRGADKASVADHKYRLLMEDAA